MDGSTFIHAQSVHVLSCCKAGVSWISTMLTMKFSKYYEDLESQDQERYRQKVSVVHVAYLLIN